MKAVQLLTSRGIELYQTECITPECVIQEIRDGKLRKFEREPGLEKHRE